jgi:hypothetical protein
LSKRAQQIQIQGRRNRELYFAFSLCQRDQAALLGNAPTPHRAVPPADNQVSSRGRLNPFEKPLRDSFVIFPVQQKVRRVRKKRPLLFTCKVIVEMFDAADPKNIVMFSNHRQDRYAHMFRFVDGTSR